MRGKKRTCVATSCTGREVAALTFEPLFNPVMMKGGWPNEGCSILLKLTDKYGTLFGQFDPQKLWEALKAAKDETRRVIDGWPKDRFLVLSRSGIRQTEVDLELVVAGETERNNKLTYVEGSFKRRDLTTILRSMNEWFEKQKAKTAAEPNDEHTSSFTYRDAVRTNRATIRTLERIAQESQDSTPES